MTNNKKRTLQEFTQLASAVHNGLYDYSASVYVSANTKLTIICPEHGPFSQIPADHLKGRGCRLCAAKKRAKKLQPSNSDFISRASAVHQGKYKYTRTVYKHSDEPIIITCPEHGDFSQTPHSHLAGSGCQACRAKTISNLRTITSEKFLVKARLIHGDKYLYNLTGYKNAGSQIQITCPQHGEFNQTARAHYSGQGCPACGTESAAETTRNDVGKFVELARKQHGSKYAYDLVTYVNNRVPVTIRCPLHGLFNQKPNGHTQGHGCPSCGVTASTMESKLFEAVKALAPDAISRDRSGIAGYGERYPLELDILVPSARLAIEINGLRWHSAAYEHKRGRDWVANHQVRKHENCRKNGVQLLTFYEDELNEKFPIVLATIKSKLLASTKCIYARTTEVKDVPWADAEKFLNQTHIQGASRPSPAKGLYYRDQLVAIMVFGKVRSIRGNSNPDIYELVRYSSSERVVGGCSKLLKAFLRDHPGVSKVISYADKRISSGQMYASLGFTLLHETPPDYVYVHKGVRRHKSGYRRSSLAKILPNFDSLLTEEENCRRHRIYKLFNCGLQRWELSVA